MHTMNDVSYTYQALPTFQRRKRSPPLACTNGASRLHVTRLPKTIKYNTADKRDKPPRVCVTAKQMFRYVQVLHAEHVQSVKENIR